MSCAFGREQQTICLLTSPLLGRHGASINLSCASNTRWEIWRSRCLGDYYLVAFQTHKGNGCLHVCVLQEKKIFLKLTPLVGTISYSVHALPAMKTFWTDVRQQCLLRDLLQLSHVKRQGRGRISLKFQLTAKTYYEASFSGSLGSLPRVTASIIGYSLIQVFSKTIRGDIPEW